MLRRRGRPQKAHRPDPIGIAERLVLLFTFTPRARESLRREPLVKGDGLAEKKVVKEFQGADLTR